MKRIRLSRIYKPDRKDRGGLVESIKSLGVVRPICVKELQNGRFTLIDGLRRLKACEQLGIETIPAKFN